MRRSPFLLSWCVLTLLGCSPTFDWREVRLQAGDAAALFPCRPKELVRTVSIANTSVAWTLLACQTGDVTFGLAAADLGDPRETAAVLQALPNALAGNLGGTVQGPFPWRVEGMTPNPSTARWVVSGKRPDGVPVRQEVAVFTRGTWVYQATLLTHESAAPMGETFFSGLRLLP